MNFKKRVNGSWVDTPNYIHNTSTDTITTLPAVIHPTGTTATVGLKGQTLQSSIPSPTSPIMPQGTGERTGNLSDMATVEDRKGIAMDGSIVDYVKRCSTTTPIDVSAYSNVTLAFTATLSSTRVIYALFNDSALVARQANVSSGTTIDVSEGNKLYICFYDVTELVQKSDLSNVMLNSGSTPLPYEPYGYKIPISSASTTTPVYLGEVETTRKIAKIDLGTLNWGKTASGTFWADMAISNCRTIGNSTIGNAICTHFTEVSANNVANTPYSFSSCLNTEARPFINKTGFENMSTTEFKEAMSGVYMYYVLATPETAVVNEPLMKIGDYADTVSGITVPTITGKDTFDVETTLKPSEASLSYTGWHDATVEEWDGSD